MGAAQLQLSAIAPIFFVSKNVNIILYSPHNLLKKNCTIKVILCYFYRQFYFSTVIYIHISNLYSLLNKLKKKGLYD